MSQNINEIPGTSPASIKMDLVRFKDEIIKDMRSAQKSLDDKYIKADDFLRQRITQFENKINSFNQKITELSNLIVTDNSIKENVESLNQFRVEMTDTIFKRRALFNQLETKVDNNIDRINKILTSSVIHPTLIGKKAKFQNFHEFMEYVIRELSQLIIFKEKNSLDLTPYKRKIEQSLEEFKILMNNYISRDYIDNLINQFEEKINNSLKIYGERLEENRIENLQYAFSLQKKTEEIWKQIENAQNIINAKLGAQKSIDLGNYNNDISHIKNRIHIINEVIKELLNYHPNSKKNFYHEFEKKSSQVYSGVKQYIRGNLNANELSTMKKFTTKVYDAPTSSISCSPVQSTDILKNDKKSRKRNSYSLNNGEILCLNRQYGRSNIRNNVKKNTSLKSFHEYVKEDALGKKYNNQEINQRINNFDKNNDNINFKRDMDIRKKTLNTKLSFELNNEISRNNKKARTIKFREKENINEVENKLDISNHLNNMTNENIYISNTNDENIKEKNNLSLNSLVVDTKSRKESLNNNDFIIKEEDESSSDNSCKNGEFSNRKKKNRKKSKKKTKEIDYNSTPEINIRKISNDKDNKIKEIINDKDNSNLKVNNLDNNYSHHLNNSENNKINIMSINKIVKLSNSENNDIKILSLKKKIKSPYSQNKKENLFLFGEKNNINNATTNNSKSNEDINSLTIPNENNINISIIEPKSKEINTYQNVKIDNLVEKPIKYNSSQQKQPKNLIINSISQKNNRKKSQSNQNSNSLDKNLKPKTPKIPINSNYKTNNNLISMNMASKTYTNFPKIFKDISENKNNNIINLRDIDALTKSLNSAKFSNKETSKVAAYVLRPKKVLLTSPDNIPPNGIIQKRSKINSFGLQNENVKNKKVDNLYNNPYYLSYQ